MEFEKKKIYKDFIVVGAGMPGICAAIQAARLGLSVALINDRGYLGGNSSAEIRVSVDGADGTHEFNLFSRETGILEEIRLEDLHRNPQYNKYIWDTVLLDFVNGEKNIEVFLNTNIDCVEMESPEKIRFVSGSQLDSEKRFVFFGDYFLDDTGDGTVGALAGAEYRTGRESKHEFNERIAPENADECVLPSTLSFSAKDVGRSVRYIPPDFALDLTKTDILNYRTIPKDRFWKAQWYYEICGRMDQVKDIEKIIRMHRELVYGIWDYIKNSGEYPSESYDLDYVACLPGKRESRRLVGDYMLSGDDLVGQKDFADTVGYGGWSIDLHAVDGFFAKEIINKHFILKGIYQIPYRSGYSRNINNLFMAGRCMSTTHVAFGSTRVMATLSTLGQALGAAAFICKKYDTLPRGVYEKHIKNLQQILLKHDSHIVGVKNEDGGDLARNAEIKVSSVKKCELVNNHSGMKLDKDIGLSIPVKDYIKSIALMVGNTNEATLDYKVYMPGKKENFNPETLLSEGSVELGRPEPCRWVEIPVNKHVGGKFIFLEITSNEDIEIGMTDVTLTGITCMRKDINKENTIIDIDTLDMKSYYWHNIKHLPCFKLFPEQDVYGPDNINNGYSRPYGLPNLWISDNRIDDEYVFIGFKLVKTISEIMIRFDSDLSYRISYGWKEVSEIPQVVRDYDVYYKSGEGYTLLKKIRGNYQRVNTIKFDAINTDNLKIVFRATNGSPYVGVYEIRVY